MFNKRHNKSRDMEPKFYNGVDKEQHISRGSNESSFYKKYSISVSSPTTCARRRVPLRGNANYVVLD